MLQIIQKVPTFLSTQYDDMITPCISARSVHHYLGSKRQFSDWIKHRIEQYDFKEGIEFYRTQNNDSELYGFQPIEYIISPNMARELGMVENNNRGKCLHFNFIKIIINS
jgi:phage anti-repressor protein